MLWLRIQNIPQIWKVNVWVGRENLPFSFKGKERFVFYSSSTRRFLYERKIIECCETQYNRLIYLGTI